MHGAESPPLAAGRAGGRDRLPRSRSDFASRRRGRPLDARAGLRRRGDADGGVVDDRSAAAGGDGPVAAGAVAADGNLRGEAAFKRAAAPYADPAIFLFLGGFMIALAIERWGLHRRMALLTLLAVGTSPSRLVGGFLLATALISMWISNTATAVMMLPIGLAVVKLLS